MDDYGENNHTKGLPHYYCSAGIQGYQSPEVDAAEQTVCFGHQFQGVLDGSDDPEEMLNFIPTKIPPPTIPQVAAQYLITADHKLPDFSGDFLGVYSCLDGVKYEMMLFNKAGEYLSSPP